MRRSTRSVYRGVSMCMRVCRRPLWMENSPVVFFTLTSMLFLFFFLHSSLSSPCSSSQLFDTRLCVEQRKNWKYYMPQIVWRTFPLSPWQSVFNSSALGLYLFFKPPLIQSWRLVLCLSQVLVKLQMSGSLTDESILNITFCSCLVGKERISVFTERSGASSWKHFKKFEKCSSL